MRTINYDIDSEIFLPCHTHDIYVFISNLCKEMWYVYFSIQMIKAVWGHQPIIVGSRGPESWVWCDYQIISPRRPRQSPPHHEALSRGEEAGLRRHSGLCLHPHRGDTLPSAQPRRSDLIALENVNPFLFKASFNVFAQVNRTCEASSALTRVSGTRTTAARCRTGCWSPSATACPPSSSRSWRPRPSNTATCSGRAFNECSLLK